METESGQATRALQLAPSQQPMNSTAATEKAAILSRLALHYWRPDFTPGQAKLLMADYLADLAEFTPRQVAEACAQYRRKPDAQFFPKIGELLELLKPESDSEPRLRLPTFRGYPALEGLRATRSVADVLRKHGFSHAAQRWETRA